MPYCKKCGSQLPEGAKFCHGCGAPAEKPIVQQESTRRGASVSSQAAKIVAIAVVGVIVVALVVGLFPTLFNAGNQIGQRINPPSVEITSKNLRTGNVGLEYTAWVDVSIHNSGGPGTVVVWCEVTQGTNSWKKSKSVHLESQGSEDLTFTFAEVAFWTTQSTYYRVWVE